MWILHRTRRLRAKYSVLSTQYLVLALVAMSSVCVAADQEPAFLGRSSKQWLMRLESQQPQERAEAAWAIAQMATDDPATPKKLLAHEDATVRYWGVLGLQRIATAARPGDSQRATILVAL